MQPGIPSYTLKRNVSEAGSGRANCSLRNGFSVLVGLRCGTRAIWRPVRERENCRARQAVCVQRNTGALSCNRC